MRMAAMSTATDTLPCIGVVLAGGRSRRMGHDKALLQWHGQPLIEHQLALLRAAGVDEAVVSGERPDYGGIADVRNDAGPVAGLAAIAQTRQGDLQLLVIPVDMPLLQPPLLRRLRSHAPDAPCLRFADKVLPLRLRVDTHCREILDTLVKHDDPRARSLRVLQRAAGLVEIPLASDEAAQLTDCNTRATWEEVTR